MIFDFKVSDRKAGKLIIIGNEKTKRKYQFNDTIENIKLQSIRDAETQLKTITILLFASEQISRHGYQNLEIIKILKEISAICFSIIFNLRDFSDSIQYKELLIGNGFNLI